MKYNKYLRRRIIHRILEGKTTLKNIDAVIELAEAASTGAKISLPGYTVEKKYRELVFAEPAKKKVVEEFRYELKFPGRTKITQLSLDISTGILRKNPVFGRDKYTVYFDAEEIDSNGLIIRSRRKGDKFRPFGSGGSKKLKDFFIDEKIPVDKRDEIPLLVNRNEILWIPGIRQADVSRVTGSTRKILKIKINGKVNNK